MSTYGLILGISGVVIISFIFNILAKKTNVPSVLMLIVLGVLIRAFAPDDSETQVLASLDILKVVGNIGLVMIVLEATLDLKLTRDKRALIGRSFAVALISLFLTVLVIACIIHFLVPNVENFQQSVIYAIPLSILSSAIIIPSMGSLSGPKKEFMVYESTFSDILGIMVFYFSLDINSAESTEEIILGIVLNIVITIVVSLVSAYILVYLFQRISSEIKLFLIISILIFMYALGKIFGFSSLLIILTFGLVLNNTNVFFKMKRLSKLINEDKVKPILRDFHVITLESSFVIRTFFFVIFGMYITIDSIFNWKVIFTSLSILVAIYAMRYLVFKSIIRYDIKPQLYLAPRGLITILLFFAIGIHPVFTIEKFDPGILLFVIIISNVIMAVALVFYSGKKVKEVVLKGVPKIKLGKRDRDDEITP